MNFEEFKKQFVEDIKKQLDENGVVASVETHEVSKLNESYESITVTPEGSNVGVNVNMDRFFEALESGTDYDSIVDRAMDIVQKGIHERPAVDVASLTDYDQMKDKLVMEVVSIEANQDLLANVPHKEMEDMAVVYRFVLDSNDDGRATRYDD